MTTSIDQATTLFQQGFNCSQAVCAAYAPSLGLSREMALRIASGFGGGMGRHGEVCGAVTGAIMAIGLKAGPIEATDAAAKENAYALSHQVIEQFKDRHGAISCRELLGCDIGQPEGLQQAREAQLFTQRCPLFVRAAAEIVSKLIEGKE
jgi:C_GCAxxG_C_C family probable redox protein